MPDPGKNIADAKQKAVDELNKHISQMGASAYAIILKEIEKAFDFKNGSIVTNKDFIKQLNKLTVEVLDLLQTAPKFNGPISQFIKRMPVISAEISSYQKITNDIKVPDFDVTKKVVVDEIFDKMLNNGLNQNFVQPLRNLIYQNATSGLSLTDARTAIKEYISGGNDISGKLHRYVEQTAVQAVDAYSGAINKKILESFKMNAQLMTGSLIDNSSPQCRYVREKLNSRITRENWPEVAAIGEKQNGWIEGTDFDNLPQNKLHHGCRHNFFPFLLKKDA